MRRTHNDQPALITTAAERSDDEYDRRRTKYAILMTLRAVCVIAAATTYRVSIWLALTFIVGGIALPPGRLSRVRRQKAKPNAARSFFPNYWREPAQVLTSSAVAARWSKCMLPSSGAAQLSASGPRGL